MPTEALFAFGMLKLTSLMFAQYRVDFTSQGQVACLMAWRANAEQEVEVERSQVPNSVPRSLPRC